jgi:hypothetical protein
MTKLGDHFLDAVQSLKDAEVRYREANERMARLEERSAVSVRLAAESRDCIRRSNTLIGRVGLMYRK